jgi:hypothetical protein
MAAFDLCRSVERPRCRVVCYVYLDPNRVARRTRKLDRVRDARRVGDGSCHPTMRPDTSRLGFKNRLPDIRVEPTENHSLKAVRWDAVHVHHVGVVLEHDAIDDSVCRPLIDLKEVRPQCGKGAVPTPRKLCLPLVA